MAKLTEKGFNKYLENLNDLTPEQWDIFLRNVAAWMTPKRTETFLLGLAQQVRFFDVAQRMNLPAFRFRLNQTIRWLEKRTGKENELH